MTKGTFKDIIQCYKDYQLETNFSLSRIESKNMLDVLTLHDLKQLTFWLIGDLYLLIDHIEQHYDTLED